MTQAKFVPEGYHMVIPYLAIDGAGAAITFYQQAFGATELMRIGGPDGKVGHAEIQIGDSRIMISDEYPGMGVRGPRTLGGSPVSILLYVEDVDAVVKRAVAAGGEGGGGGGGERTR